MTNKRNVLGVTSGIGSMLIPFAFDDNLKDRTNVLGNVEWREYYRTSKFFESNFHAPIVEKYEELGVLSSSSNTDIDFAFGHPECGSYSNLHTSRKNIVLDGDESDIGDFIRKIQMSSPKFFLMDDLYPSLEFYNAHYYASKLPDYDIFFEPVSNYHYGNPQKGRKRFFLVGAKKDLKFSFQPGETNNVVTTVKDVIGDLPVWDDIPELSHVHLGDEETHCWYKGEREGVLYVSQKGSGIIDEETGEEIKRERMTYNEVAKIVRKNYREGQVFKYVNSSGEMKSKIGFTKSKWDGSANVLHSGGRYGVPSAYHPFSGLPLTVRERGRIQGFPDRFSFVLPDEYYGNDLSAKKINERIHLENITTGKSMPVQFCRYAANQFFDHLEGKEDSSSSNERYYGNIPDLISINKMEYCKEIGYSNQEKACHNCWLNNNCSVQSRKIFSPFF